MKYFSAFTGVGGFEIGLPKEWECVGFSEIDKWCNMVLKYHWPKVVNYGDISRIEWSQVPDFDLFVGGSPCQDVSLAGKRKGLSGERSGLFFQYINALKQKNPRYFIFENVKGMLSSNSGFDFARVLMEFSEAGYDFQYQVLNAKNFGVPQNRERVFVVGHLRGESSQTIFFEQKDGKKINGKKIASALQGGAHSGGLHSQMDYMIVSGNNREREAKSLNHTPNIDHNAPILVEMTQNQSQGNRIYSSEGLSTSIASQAGGRGTKTGLYLITPTIRAEHHNTADVHFIPVLTPNRAKKRQNGRRFKKENEPMFTLTGQDIHGIATESSVRRLTPKECERLMSWPDDWTRWGTDERGKKVEISDTQRYKMCGNGVVSNVIRELSSPLSKVEFPSSRVILSQEPQTKSQGHIE